MCGAIPSWTKMVWLLDRSSECCLLGSQPKLGIKSSWLSWPLSNWARNFRWEFRRATLMSLLDLIPEILSMADCACVPRFYLSREWTLGGFRCWYLSKDSWLCYSLEFHDPVKMLRIATCNIYLPYSSLVVVIVIVNFIVVLNIFHFFGTIQFIFDSMIGALTNTQMTNAGGTFHPSQLKNVEHKTNVPNVLHTQCTSSNHHYFWLCRTIFMWWAKGKAHSSLDCVITQI